MRTGILGGTFDPIHIAHLHAAETALYAGLDRVLFVPAGDPWQKQHREVTPADLRAEMVELAIANIEGFVLDRREIEREGPTYTIETLESFPDSEELFLILGADSAAGIQTWHRWQDVLVRARVLVVPRPGTPDKVVTKAVPEALQLEMAALDVSSTMIRGMIKQGRPARFLLPPGVNSYIAERNLYTEEQVADKVEPTTEEE